jgi:AcrR family transcriptional regulator
MTEIYQALLEEDKSTLDRIRINALEHFSKYGYMGASVREITAGAQVTKPTLYYYFQNKEELYRGVAASCIKNLLDCLRESISASGNLSTRYCAFVEAYYSFCDRDFPAARFIHVISGTPSRDVPDVGIDEFQNNITEVIFGIVRGSQDAGEVADEQQMGLHLILQGLFAIAVDRRLKGMPLPSEELRRTLECFTFQKK